MDDVHVTARARPGRCAFCRDDIPNDVLATCSSCATTYHRDCLERELGGACATRGCSAPVVKAKLRAGEKPVVPWTARSTGPRPGSTRSCGSCREVFVVREASPYSPLCFACARRNNYIGFLLVLAAFVIYAVIAVASHH